MANNVEDESNYLETEDSGKIHYYIWNFSIFNFQFPDEESKARRDILVSNGLDEKIYIEIQPIRLVAQTELQEQQVHFGVGLLNPEANLGVSISYYIQNY